jgi:hypothetical protein
MVRGNISGHKDSILSHGQVAVELDYNSQDTNLCLSSLRDAQPKAVSR